MAETKKKNVFQKLAAIAKDFVEWLEETFGDPELAKEIKDDLGLNPDNPATPAPLDGAVKARIDTFAAKEDIDEAALAAVIADLVATFDTVMTFIEAAKADGVDAQTLFWTLFKVFALDVLRVRNPSGYALVRILGLVVEDDETVGQLDGAALAALVRGDGDPAAGEKWVQRLSTLGGAGVVIAANKVKAVSGTIDAAYGWDPDPGEEGEAAVVASRALTVVLDAEVLAEVRPAITIIGVPTAHGGPGLFLSTTTAFKVSTDIGVTTWTVDLVGAGQFGAFVRLDPFDVSFTADFAPAIRLSAVPELTEQQATDAPALLIGTSDATRLQVGALALDVEVAGDHAGVRVGIKKGKLVIALGKGDAFLRQLPGGNIEVPFELAMVVDGDGVRFEGGTGLKVNLPVSASVFGVFTTQFLELELRFQPALALDIVGGFSLNLGPFVASVDRIGATLALSELSKGPRGFGDLVKFAPPKGIGLALDAGVVKGGGYLFIDAERGEYAGALELKFLTWSIKAIGLISTKRPDGSEGFSLLLFVFGKFEWHIAFGIFWTGLGGMIGLHHRSDVDALSAGMKTGALDDILFPENPVADAPRIINRYRTLFPIEDGNFLIGPMLEFSFSKPPIVYIRLGLIFDIRNALGGGNGPAALSKVVLVGQMLVQIPPKETHAPAILKLLVDVVGFYDADSQFLLIRARLRDSFVGIEHFAKLDLSGEMLVAIQFGSDPNFVLSAGGFHPKYEGLPARVPRELERLKVSFGIGPVKLAVEQYFAITPNSVQAGQKVSLSADFGVASIEASLGWDALLYLSPRFYFIIDLEFRAKVKAFGKTLASVKVVATLEGPDRWLIQGTFSFSILWWDKTIPFDEQWGEIEAADAGTISLTVILQRELDNPDNLTPEAPAVSPFSLAPTAGTRPIAHPLGRLAIRQGVVPFELVIDRVGTKRIEGGAQSVAVAQVALNDRVVANPQPTTEFFARGQFIELTTDEKLTGKVLEPFRSGVMVGRNDFVAPDQLARDVTARFETVRLDPEPDGLLSKWLRVDVALTDISHADAVAATRLGAAARSERAFQQSRGVSTLAEATIAVSDPPLALVEPDTLRVAASLFDAAAGSASIAGQQARLSGLKLVESFEVVT